jgi:DNA-binding PadR family transcriptional regulator
MLELAVLGLLKEQPLHGYELKKRLGETLGSLWGVSYGSLYPALRRLERSGAIEIVDPATGPAVAAVPTGSVKGDLAAARLRAVADRLSSGSRRTRKAYRLTDRGEGLFTELMLGDDDRGDDERAFALKLAFCGHLAPPARLQLLERRRDALRTSLAPVRPSRTARGAGRAPDRYLTALVEHRTRAIQRDLEWVEGLIELERGDAVARAIKDNDHTIEQGATA